jgi:ATP-dependent Clp protease ATP-binding subunit ClpA
MQALRTAFRPEFLNRVDGVLIFKSLDLEDVKLIVALQLRGVNSRLEERKIRLELTEDGRSFLAQEGYDIEYGARPIRRAIRRFLLEPLSQRLLDADFREGDIIVADAASDGESLLFRRGGRVAEAEPVGSRQ